MILRKTMILIISLFASTIVYAQDTASGLGPDVGGKIPHDLSLMATSGKVENYQSLSGENGLAIFFVRSFDWCPHCQRQAIDFNSRAADFKTRGINPVSISYDSPEIQKNFYDKWEFTVPILSDKSLETIIAFDILNDSASKSSPIYGYPHPIVFIIGTDGVICAKLYIESDTVVNGSNDKERPSVDAILEDIDSRS